MATVRTNFPTFDERALRFDTGGSAFDEGPYSKPVLTHLGQTWKFSVWLRGAQGGELVNVGIWEYATDGTHTGYANLPVVLTDQLTQHTVQVTVTDPAHDLRAGNHADTFRPAARDDLRRPGVPCLDSRAGPGG